MTVAPLRIQVGRKDYPVTLSPAEAGELLGVSDETIRRRCLSGEIPALERHDGQVWRIPTGHLLDVLGIPFKVSAAK
jgi:excisionase family DNA binding protein